MWSADDTSDYAPGYYDDKGKGGHKRVASQKESEQVPDNMWGTFSSYILFPEAGH